MKLLYIHKEQRRKRLPATKGGRYSIPEEGAGLASELADLIAEFCEEYHALVGTRYEMLEVHLPTVERMHPTRRCLQRVVDDAVYATFKAKFVSLRDLALEAGVHSRTKMVELRKRGIHPEPGFPDRVHLYLRSRLE